MNILVIGGTGSVGSLVVQGLLARGQRPRVLTRSREKIRALPTNVFGVVGDTSRPETLPGVLQDVERLVLITALSENEAAEGRAAVAAARAAGVRRVVFLSVHDVEKCPEAPHFRSKIEIQQALEASGLEWTTVKPNNFFQNDWALRQAIVDYGVYPQPLGSLGLSRVDTRDVADAMVVAATEDGHVGRSYALVGPDVLGGAETAAAWSRALGREVRYAGDDLEAWAAQARQALPGWLVDDLGIMYAFFQRHGLRANANDLARQERLLSHPPRRFADFAQQTAAAWEA
jgi:uncharacterized protein YbjT (DUF2867 family)